MMLVFLRDTALLWVIPTPETVRALPGLLALAGEEIAVGAAPLEASMALSLLIVGGTGLLTIIVDHVVLTARMPLLAAIGLIAVSLIPSIAVPGEVDIMAFVLLAAAILFLMRTDTRSREEPVDREATRSAGVPATALGIGAIAVVVSLVAVPLLPQPVVRAGSGTLGSGPGIDATLQPRRRSASPSRGRGAAGAQHAPRPRLICAPRRSRSSRAARGSPTGCAPSRSRTNWRSESVPGG